MFKLSILTEVVKRPMNSGIIPNLVKSSGMTLLKSPSSLVSLILALKPILVPLSLLPIMSFNPTNAPPAMNNIFLVSISVISLPGCLRPPPEDTRQTVPSTSLSNACCTPSPDTSRVMLVLSPLRAILSISSIKIIPFSAFLISPPAALTNMLIIDSTSSPT